MQLKYIKGIFKSSKGKIVEVIHHDLDYYTVKIAVDAKMRWNAGEFAMFTLKDKSIKGKKYRMFSVASLPRDGHILIGFRTGKNPSSFKEFIINEGVNMEIKIRGPFGAFRLRDDLKPVVLYASGVGITPIISLLKDIENHNGRAINVVYASSGFYLFKEEIDRIVKEHSNIKIVYTKTTEETQGELVKLATRLGNSAYYYNSGAPFVIKSVKALLRKNGIKNKNLINDSFSGYKKA